MPNPIGIQCSRQRGYRLPPNTIRVTRPSRWGNPFKQKPFHLEYSFAEIPQLVAGRLNTRMSTLMHKTVVEDSAKSRIAPADYILVFKKPGKNLEPITHVHGFREYAGERPIPGSLKEYLSYTGDQRANSLSHWIYRQYASPVWMDIRRDRLMPYDEARDNPEEKHVCPLQLDAIDRCLALWSNPGDTVLSPFMGVGSEVYEAVRMGRRAIGTELKATYYRQAAKNLRSVDQSSLEMSFDLSEEARDALPEEGQVKGELAV
jgi:DNA modification methylase